MILKGRWAPACSTFQTNLSSKPWINNMSEWVKTYILDCSHCSMSLCGIEFAVLVLIKVLWDHVVSVADQTIAIKVICLVRHTLLSPFLNEFSSCLNFGIRERGVLPPLGYFYWGLIMQNVASVMTDLCFRYVIEAETVDTWWLMEGRIEFGLLEDLSWFGGYLWHFILFCVS